MIKVGVVTLNDNNNYGNRLQAYAVQEFFRKNSLISENIYTGPNICFNMIKSKIKFLINHKNQRSLSRRYKYFKQFNRNISFSKFKIIKGNVSKKIDKEYDCFFVGSDQVWNPHFAANKEYFLPFTDNKKKNSFAASIAVNELPEESEEYFKEMLKTFNKISVREESGKKIVENLTERSDIEVLVDPTMLLTAEEWNKVSKRPKQLDRLKNNKYILNYFLGNYQDEWKHEIERIAEENNCTIINILDPNDPFYYTGPSEFLYLEKNAFCICTDSFHSCVFSIIYQVPFFIFDRKEKGVKSMNSRLDTLLSKFNLENRKFNGKITNDLLKCDYSNAKITLKNEQKIANDFIKKALDI